jgi:predicted ribosome quality control (RQC) complex YloA/Tae2 family protein
MAVNTAINMFIGASRLDRRRGAAVRRVTREIRRWKKAELAAKEASQAKEAADRFRKLGEIIVANLRSIRKGVTEAHVPDPYSEVRAEISITLEPHLSPQANAEAYFKKARKSLRRARLADKNLATARSKLTELHRLERELESEGLSDERLGEIENLFARRTATGKPKPPVDEKAVRLGIKPRRYVVTGGWTVLVGRSARENDVLTHKYAAPGDLWFHARQAQGSHVVLKKGRKKSEVPKAAIVDAARLAAHYSKARTSKHVPVSYAERRYIKKVRKGPPGVCVMLREKVIFVEPGLPRATESP